MIDMFDSAYDDADVSLTLSCVGAADRSHIFTLARIAGCVDISEDSAGDVDGHPCGRIGNLWLLVKGY